MCSLQCLQASGPAGAPAGASRAPRELLRSRPRAAPQPPHAGGQSIVLYNHVKDEHNPCTLCPVKPPTACSSNEAPLDKTLRHSCLPVCDWP